MIFGTTENTVVNAQTLPTTTGEGEEETDSSVTKLNNPLTGTDEATDVNVLIGTVINGIMGVVGSLALLMFVYGGLLWMTSSGNSEQVEKGKKTLIYAALGLIVIFASYALVALVLNVISGTG